MFRISSLLRATSVVVLACASTSAGARELPGFPTRVGAGEPQSSPAVADLDGDGQLDIVVGIGDEIFAITRSGSALPGFPAKLGELPDDAKKLLPSSPALCALDGGARRSIVTGGPDARLYVLESDGSPRAGFPIEVGAQISSPPLCADVDGDGSVDIVVAVPGKHVLGVDKYGKKLKGFPVKGVVPAESAIAAADLVPGAPLELVVGGDDGRLHVFDGRGRVDASKRARTKYRITGGASVGDVDGDGVFDVVFGSQDFHVYAIDGKSGEAKPGFPVKTGYRIYGSPALGDLTGDGIVDIVVGSADGQLYAVDGWGRSLPGWPVAVDGRVEGAPAIGDVDLDGELEVVALATGGSIHVLEPNGKAVAGTPIQVNGKLVTSPFLVELDGKGTPEIIAISPGELHAFTVRARGKLPAARIPWATYGHDAERVSRTRPNPARFTELRIEPARARTTDELVLRYTYEDLDGGKEGATRIAWFRDGKRVPELDDKRTVPPNFTKKGQKWTVRVQEAADHAIFGEGPGARFSTSAPLEILNTAPSAPTLAAVGVATGEVRVGDAIELKVDKDAGDVDGDRVRYRTVWTVDEVPVKLAPTAMALPPRSATRGQRVVALVIPSDGVEEGEPAQLSWTLSNTPPSPPRVTLEPKVPSRASGARLVIGRPGQDPDGDPVHHEVTWQLDGAPLPLVADALEVPGGLLVRGAKLRAQIVAHDGRAASTPVSLEVTVGNNAPGAPELRLAPEAPTADTPLGLTLVKAAPDADGDVPGYVVSWKVDGALVSELEGAWSVPVERLKKGQRWQVFVVADDGAAKGPLAMASVVIGNRPPVPPVVAIQPMEPVGDQPLALEVRQPASDPDGDAVNLQIEWLVDGAPLPASARDGMGVRAGIAKKGQRVSVRVKPLDGTDAGLEIGDAVVVGDRPPSAPVLTLLPSAPRTRDDVTVSLARPGQDPDGDRVSYRYRWLLDGAQALLPDDATTLPAALTRQGMTVEVEAVALADGLASPIAKAAVTIGSTPPPAPVIAIEPATPMPGEPLRLHVVKQEPDADGAVIRYDVTWRRNGAEAEKGPAVVAGQTRKGERWQVEVVAHDDADRAPPVRAEVVIGNQAPVAPRIALSKREVTTTEDVSLAIVQAAQDPDGDPLTLDIEWKKNGKRVTSFDGARAIPASATKKGERWTVTVIARDGEAAARLVTDGFVVVDTPPPAVSVRLEPAAPKAGEALRAVITPSAPDADGDRVRYAIRFLVNGVPMKKHDGKSPVLPAKAFVRGDRVVVEVVPHDGELPGPAARAEAVAENSPPVLAGVRVEPAAPTPGESLRCVPTSTPSDADGDPVTVRVAWEIDGQLRAAAGPDARLEAGQVTPGAKVRCRAIADDGRARSSEALASVVEIGSRPPAGLAVALFPSAPRTGEAVRCGASGAPVDPDGDPIAVEVVAVLDGRPLSGPEIAAREVRAGRKVGCRATPKDPRRAGAVATVETTVGNARPAPAVPRLSSAWPRQGVDDLACDVAERAKDPEGDKLRYRIEWWRDGKPAGLPPNAQTVPASTLRAGEVWVCRLFAQDDEGEGAPSASAAALVREDPAGSSLEGRGTAPKVSGR